MDQVQLNNWLPKTVLLEKYHGICSMELLPGHELRKSNFFMLT